jgi:hypothetical protein
MAEKLVLNKESGVSNYTIVLAASRIESFKEAVEFVNKTAAPCKIVYLLPVKFKGKNAFELNLETTEYGMFSVGVMLGTYEERKRLSND